MKNLKFYGGIVILIILILFDIGIYSLIFGIPIAPVTTITDTIFDALSGNNTDADASDLIMVMDGQSHGNVSDADVDSTADSADAEKTPSGSAEDKAEAASGSSKDTKEAASDSSKDTKDAASDSSKDANGKTSGDVAGSNVDTAQSGEKGSGSNTETSDAPDTAADNTSEKNTAETPEIAYAELSGIPIYSILNGPENTFLNKIAGYDDNDYSYTMVPICVPADGIIYDTPAPVVLKVPDDEPDRTYEVQVYSTLEKNTVFVQRGIPSGGSAEVYNLIPGDLCGYQIFAEEYTVPSESGEGTQVVHSRLVKSESFCVRSYEMRGIKTETLNNVRDLGGWPTLDGRHVRYGLLYRGSAFDGGGQRLLSDSDTALFLNRLGIRNELDLRWDSEIMLDGVSTLSDSTNYVRVPLQLYLEFVSDENNGEQLNQIFDMLNADGPLYFHCAIGCDRTGTISFLLLGLLGVSESNINKEYELSSFSIYGLRTRDNTETYYKEMIAYIKDNFQGATLQEKIQNYLLQRGVSQEKLDTFIAKMLE